MVTLLSTAEVKTSGLTVVPLGERILLVTSVPLGAPSKGDRKGVRLKTQREEVMRQTGLVSQCSLSCTVLKNTVTTAEPSNNNLEEVKEKNLIK